MSVQMYFRGEPITAVAEYKNGIATRKVYVYGNNYVYADYEYQIQITKEQAWDTTNNCARTFKLGEVGYTGSRTGNGWLYDRTVSSNLKRDYTWDISGNNIIVYPPSIAGGTNVYVCNTHGVYDSIPFTGSVGSILPFNNLNYYNSLNDASNMHRESNVLTGSPYCPDSVLNASNMYYNCRNLTGSPVVGNCVVDASGMYYNCNNLTGSPVCPNGVVNTNNMYRSCTNLTGSPVCPNGVVNASGMYYYCRGLTGNFVCSNTVVDASNMYRGCNLSGPLVCPDSVVNASNMYESSNSSSSPVCSNRVKDASYMYDACQHITGSPVCPDSVTNAQRMYYTGYLLTGAPVVGRNVEDFRSMYYRCDNIKGVCDLTNVKAMNMPIGDYIPYSSAFAAKTKGLTIKLNKNHLCWKNIPSGNYSTLMSLSGSISSSYITKQSEDKYFCGNTNTTFIGV